MNCAVAIRRDLPSTFSEKSCAVRSATGRPLRSRTLTSTGTRSTDDLKVGLGCGSCAGAAVCAAAEATHAATVNAGRSNFKGDLFGGHFPDAAEKRRNRPLKNKGGHATEKQATEDHGRAR